MIQHHEKHIVDFPPDSFFTVILDIESYPQFLPGWITAHIRARETNQLVVEQQLGVGPMNWNFTSIASYRRPVELQIRSQDGPFRRLEIDWKVAETEDMRSLVEFHLQAEFSTPLLEKPVKHLLSLSTPNIVARFEKRVCLLDNRKTGTNTVKDL